MQGEPLEMAVAPDVTKKDMKPLEREVTMDPNTHEDM